MAKITKDLSAMSLGDLEKKILALQEESFRLRCNNQIGQLTDKIQLRKTRRDLARAKTVQTLRMKK